MTNTEPVATPRTEALVKQMSNEGMDMSERESSLQDFARQLERELQAERERAEKAKAELAALEVKTWNAAIEAAAEGFELDDGHYYDQVRESILRLKK